MCDFCPAHRDPAEPGMLYNNFSKSAHWKRKLFTTAQWLSIYEGVKPHPVFMVLGIGHYSIEPDELHVIYLGTLQYLLGSVLYLLVYKILGHGADKNLAAVWSAIQKDYAKHKVSCQIGNLTLSSFVDPKSPHMTYPKFRGKGAESRDLVGPMLSAWVELVPSDYLEKNIVTNMLRNQQNLQDILSEHKTEMFLPSEAVQNFRSSIDKLLIDYQKVAASADRRGDLIWNMPTKWHWLWHLGERAQYLNPRRAATMLNEDFVSHKKDLTHSCAAGTELHQTSIKASTKHRWGFHFESKMR